MGNNQRLNDAWLLKENQVISGGCQMVKITVGGINSQ